MEVIEGRFPGENTPLIGDQDGDDTAELAERQHVVEGRHGLILKRPTAVIEAVLRKVTDGRGTRHDDITLVTGFGSGKDAEKRGLAGTVGSGEPDPIAFGNVPSYVLEYDMAGKCLGEGVNLKHGPIKSPAQ